MEIVGETPKRGLFGDWLGVICSLGCAIHCAAMPILLSVLPSLTAVKWLADPLFHQVVAVLCAIIVSMAILPAWRQHRSRAVAALATTGVGLLFVAAFILPDQCCAPVESSIASASSSTTGQAEPTLAARQTSGQNLVPTRLASFPKVESHSSIESKQSCSDDCVFCRRNHAHAATYGRPLFTVEQLESRFGSPVAQRLVSWQPYLSPLGGVLLILGHLVNIRLQACGCRKHVNG